MFALESEETTVVLISLEAIDLQLGEPPRRPGQETAVLQDLLQEERIGVIEHGQVDFTPREDLLQLLDDRAALVERGGTAAEEHRDVEIAGVMDSPLDRRSEL